MRLILLTINLSCFKRDWEQLDNLKELQFLTDLVFLGNPVEEEASEDGTYISKYRHFFLTCNTLEQDTILHDC